jgi:hypothetical protein
VLPLKLASLVEAAPVIGPTLSESSAEDEDDTAWTATIYDPPSVRLKGSVEPNLPVFAPPTLAAKHVLTESVALNESALKQRIAEIGPEASGRLVEKFAAATAPWPPAQIGLITIKDEKALDLYARSGGGRWKFVFRYRLLASSGVSGPKLRQGDRQIPEGIYGISFLNPNSHYHVSLRVNYPNAFDRRMATRDGRKDLGGDIMIHGKNASAGCLAIGDEAAEEVFVLAEKVGLRNVKLIIAPTDFRQHALPAPPPATAPQWVPALYTEVAHAMADFDAPAEKPAPKSEGLLSFIWK